MKLTEGQIRSIVRSVLIAENDRRRLEEQGVMAALKSGMALLFKGLGAVIGAAFGKAESDYDPSKFEVTYASAGEGKSAENLSPKTDAYDQVYALGRVLWHIDAAIELALQSMGYGAEKLRGLEFPVDPEDTGFSSVLEEATGNVSEAAGYFKGYLSRAKSSKVSDVGASMNPGDSLSETLKNLAEAVSAVESLKPVSDWETIIKSKAVNTHLQAEGEKSESMKNLINEVKGSSMQNIPKLGELKGLIDEANKIALQAEEVINFAAEEKGEKPEDSGLLDHLVRETELRVLISEMINRAKK